MTYVNLPENEWDEGENNGLYKTRLRRFFNKSIFVYNNVTSSLPTIISKHHYLIIYIYLYLFHAIIDLCTVK